MAPLRPVHRQDHWHRHDLFRCLAQQRPPGPSRAALLRNAVQGNRGATKVDELLQRVARGPQFLSAPRSTTQDETRLGLVVRANAVDASLLEVCEACDALGKLGMSRAEAAVWSLVHQRLPSSPLPDVADVMEWMLARRKANLDVPTVRLVCDVVATSATSSADRTGWSLLRRALDLASFAGVRHPELCKEVEEFVLQHGLRPVSHMGCMLLRFSQLRYLPSLSLVRLVTSSMLEGRCSKSAQANCLGHIMSFLADMRLRDTLHMDGG